MSSTPLRLGLDIDGVFADFNGAPDTHGFSRLIRALSGRDLFPRPWVPTDWHWWRGLGYKQSEWDAAWEHVYASPDFWATLRAYPGAADTLSRVHALSQRGQMEVYFLTTRPGLTAHYQSRFWLELKRPPVVDPDGGVFAPQVLICGNSESKGLVARALALDLVLDDYVPNLEAVVKHAPDTRVALYRQPWNADAVTLPSPRAETVEGHEALRARLEAWSRREWSA